MKVSMRESLLISDYLATHSEEFHHSDVVVGHVAQVLVQRLRLECVPSNSLVSRKLLRLGIVLRRPRPVQTLMPLGDQKPESESSESSQTLLEDLRERLEELLKAKVEEFRAEIMRSREQNREEFLRRLDERIRTVTAPIVSREVDLALNEAGRLVGDQAEQAKARFDVLRGQADGQSLRIDEIQRRLARVETDLGANARPAEAGVGA